MSALPYLIMAAVSIWALIATVVAITWGKHLGLERQVHQASHDKMARYRTALLRLKEQAEAQASQLELLEREYVNLKNSLAGQEHDAVEHPIPMIMLDTLDISSEVGILFEHVARVAVAIRNYSAYTRGHHASELARARYDLLWLADCLHSFDQVGKALARGSVASLYEACQDLAAMYDKYLSDASGYNSRDTFQRLAEAVPLAQVTDAIKSMTVKTAPSPGGMAGAQNRDQEIDRFVASVAPEAA